MKRRRQGNSQQPRTSRWNRLNLKFFGPPSIGHYEGPWEEAEADPICRFCGRPESEHFRDTNADGKHFRRCPTTTP